MDLILWRSLLSEGELVNILFYFIIIVVIIINIIDVITWNPCSG